MRVDGGMVYIIFLVNTLFTAYSGYRYVYTYLDSVILIIEDS